MAYGGAEDGPLDVAHLRRYVTALTFEGMFDGDEVERYLAELQRLRSDEAAARPETITEPESGQVRSIFAVHRHSELMNRLCRDRRVVEIARQLLGGPVYFHQTRVN
ncbi:MAG: phytanoyl-CoA dioxygenase family protein [Thermoanaerobaculia bacterium]